jgi:hypothetical protein
MSRVVHVCARQEVISAVVASVALEPGSGVAREQTDGESAGVCVTHGKIVYGTCLCPTIRDSIT